MKSKNHPKNPAPHLVPDLSAVLWGVTADLQESANLVINSATINDLD